jgi:DNA-binding XRE family transcriptional regulator
VESLWKRSAALSDAHDDRHATRTSEGVDEPDELDSYLRDQLEDPAFRAAFEDAQERSGLLRELIDHRRRIGASQAAVADRMGTTQSAVSELEGGATDPRLSTLQRYARALGLRLNIGVGRADGTTAKGPEGNYVRGRQR